MARVFRLSGSSRLLKPTEDVSEIDRCYQALTGFPLSRERRLEVGHNRKALAGCLVFLSDCLWQSSPLVFATGTSRMPTAGKDTGNFDILPLSVDLDSPGIGFARVEPFSAWVRIILRDGPFDKMSNRVVDCAQRGKACNLRLLQYQTGLTRQGFSRRFRGPGPERHTGFVRHDEVTVTRGPCPALDLYPLGLRLGRHAGARARPAGASRGSRRCRHAVASAPQHLGSCGRADTYFETPSADRDGPSRQQPPASFGGDSPTVSHLARLG